MAVAGGSGVSAGQRLFADVLSLRPFRFWGLTVPTPSELLEAPRDPAWETVWAIRDSTRLDTSQIILGCIGLVVAVGLSVLGQIAIGTLIAAMVPTVLVLVGRR